MEPVESNRHTKAASAVEQGRPVEARFVRSGGKGKAMMPTLVISLLGAALVLIALLFFWSGAFSKAAQTSSATPPPAVQSR